MTHHDPWQCCICGTTYCVPTLARLCEAKHEQETRPAKAATLRSQP